MLESSIMGSVQDSGPKMRIRSEEIEQAHAVLSYVATARVFGSRFLSCYQRPRLYVVDCISELNIRVQRKGAATIVSVTWFNASVWNVP